MATRIKNQDFDLYDDFLMGLTATKKAGELMWRAEASDASAVATVPTAIDGHPGVVKVTAVDQTGWGDAFLDSATSFLAKDLKRFVVVYKPNTILQSVQEAADVCTAYGSQNIAFLSPGGYQIGDNRWYLSTRIENVAANDVIDDSLNIPMPDGDTWFVCELHFDYANQKIWGVINGVKVAEKVITSSTFWNIPMKLIPVYAYTERGTIADHYVVIDQVAVEFNNDLTDARPDDAVQTLRPGTTRTDNK
jgi:hypothetical protein